VCIENTPVVNRLYGAMQDDPTLKKDIKLMGIGVGNNPKQLEAFKKVHRVKFPLITDEEGEAWTALGSAATPSMVITTPAGKVLASHVGPIKDFDAFLKEIKELHKKL
jgi:peroxiredoxin